jgi:hypothetical protein
VGATIGDPDRRVNTSDPDSRVMPIKKGWLQDQGQDIEVMTEDDFLRSL